MAYGGTVNPPRNRKGGAGNPPPTGARASALPDSGSESSSGAEASDRIDISEFAKIDLRVAKVLGARLVDGADKLLEIRVDIGDEERTVFAGIRDAYSPESLVGRHVVVVANLAPRAMRFGVSDGMILAAGPGGSDIWLLGVDEGVTTGMQVK